jgi:ataxia telangiectasia mutated family protein
VLLNLPRLAIEIFPAMVHLILEIEIEGKQELRPELSLAINKYLDEKPGELGPRQDYLLDLVLYLRRQPYPKEHTKVDRIRWLDIDYMRAAATATQRGKPTLALMLAETSAPPPVQTSRRASSRMSSVQQLPADIPESMLLSIFEQVDEPDSFYGVEQPASLESVLGRLDYEKAGFKSLMFRSAQVDSHMRNSGQLSSTDALGVVRSLSSLNLSSLTFALTSGQMGSGSIVATEEMLDSARKLQQWDIPLPESSVDGSSRLLTIYQELRQATTMTAATDALNVLTLEHVRAAQNLHASVRPSRAWFNCLGLIAESLELASSASQTELTTSWSRLQSRESWMNNARFEDFDLLQQGRITTFSVLGRNETLLKDLRVTRNTMRTSEVQALLSYSALARQHGQLQTALCAATQVNDLARDLKESGIYVDVVAKHEVASVLWESQERTASVKMLRDTLDKSEFEAQEIEVGRSGVLAQLGTQLADARLEKPSDILEQYLRPAIAHLPRNAVGKEAGKVYHAFAVFCDQQLQHPANVEDFNRITTLRQRKRDEVQQLQTLVKATRRATEAKEHERSLNKARQWLKLDDQEYEHQKASRETFVQQSLQNYLLALHASDEHDLSVLRFFALWLESSESDLGNAVVKTHLPNVPSWKFVVLLNQLMSRLQNDNTTFQVALMALTKRLCLEHPYHSVHHVYASTKGASSGDAATVTRYDAAVHVRKYVSGDSVKGNLFKRLFHADSQYRQLADEPLADRKTGKRALKDIRTAVAVAKYVPTLHLPPVTISLPLRPDGNYDDIPVVQRFEPTVSIMSGLSSPKVLTARSSNGQQYKQLFKSGNDDLRQDAIMEQVFEEVSKMLQNHKATRQRNLHIRTYKVIPLSPTAGIIEFVPNSIPINEFLTPAHPMYNPQDMKNSTARERVKNAQAHSTETRVKEFRKVCENFQPVMRHFFLERFDDPDDWFEKRTAYTRTTASVSMLGHVLGLGDRHGHNIMLDEVNGEVVHIDLGVAFEAGRVLPVPELVPFRLTRDIIDGMGVNKTEGIFRRCCEFTMDALREDKDSIMTLLNVLRYDPLYNWTLSPLRAKRMQDAQDSIHNAKNVEAAGVSKAKLEAEGGEADRALAIVEKKLSKTLSTAATVNELIQQATDEKNLATLFAGWAAWF